MSIIKHIQYQSGTEEVFTLNVVDGEFAGVYVVEKPDAFDEADCIVDINEEFFNVQNFIIGDSEKITFLEYSNPIGYDIVKKVYEEQGGDAVIIFNWKAVNGANQYDLLGSGYQLNLNKYNHSFDKSMMKIETEIKKREVQNKFITREDVSVNLFTEKDLDNLEVDPLITDQIYYKEGGRIKSNFYSFHDAYKYGFGMKRFQFMFIRPIEYDLGNIANEYVGWNYNSTLYKGPLTTSNVSLDNLALEISNMNILTSQPFKLNILITNGTSEVRRINEILTPNIVSTTLAPEISTGVSQLYEFKVVNQSFDVGVLNQGESIHLLFEKDGDSNGNLKAVETTTSLELKSIFNNTLRKTKIIRLKDAIERIARIYSGVDIPVQSTIINSGGYYFDTAISTGMFMRGLPEVYNTNKITTSFKNLFYDSVAKLFAFGFDLQDDKIIVEDIKYFFKDVETYDFTDKEFIQDEFSTDHDLEISNNQLAFGSKKFSTNKKGDLLNYNTKLDAVTPLKSVKTKFDKTIDAIIDADKIQELILDKSSSTNDGDDDLVIIDLVKLESYYDEGMISNCEHANDGGFLTLTSYDAPFDTLAIEVGQNITIENGLNTGTYEVLEIDGAKMKLNKTSGIEVGENDTPISFYVYNITKNRNDEGFDVSNVKEPKSATNLRHNPKYQMARWFGFYGSGLNNKPNSDEIIVTNYKNNGDVILEPTTSDLDNELQGITTLKNNETLERLRDYKTPIFSGQIIEITLREVLFSEFYECYTKWRYDDVLNRGFISVNTNEGLVEIYPFGAKAFEFSGQFNELTIRGKIRNQII